MSRTKVMLIGALPVGSGNARMPFYNGGGVSPDWRTNYFPNHTTVPSEPQNLLRVSNGAAAPFTVSSSGLPGVQLDAHMLGRVGSFLRGPEESGQGGSIRQRYENAVAENPGAAVNSIGVLSASLGLLGAGIGGYHGYKRTGGKIGPMIGWGLAGLVFPVITTGVAMFQGVGERKRS